MRLGAHESIAGGVHKALDRAQSVGCETLQVFVKPNRNWSIPELTEEDVSLFREKSAEMDIQPIIGHTSYLLNLASPKLALWQRSRDTLIVELERADRLGAVGLVLHPGAHVGSGEQTGLERIAQALGDVHTATPEVDTQILLETTAGQGTTLGYSFEQLAWLIDETPDGDRLGVCLDTCHVFAAGYELRTAEGYAQTIEAFDRTIGLERLKALHLNDCKGELGSRKDRHDHIGDGYIGLRGFRHVVNDPRLQRVPGLLETPKGKDLREDRKNLAVLRELMA